MRNITTALLIAIATAGFTGCGSIQGHSESAYTSAAETSANYDKLSRTIDNAKARLQSIRKTPGGPEVFLKNIEEIDKMLGEAGDSLKDSRESLISSGAEHTRLLDAEADKFADESLVKDIRANAQELREGYAAYEQESGSTSESIDLARKYFDDIRRLLELSRTPKSVESCLGTVGKIDEALSAAKAKIPAAKASLEKLRKSMPKPATVS